MQRVQWNADALPYGQSIDRVLYDMRRDDEGRLLLDAVTVEEIIEDADGVLLLDALVLPFAQLRRRMELLLRIMERTIGKVKPVAMQITDPFKQRGVANVAVIFELSDGQTVSIYFHNPDTTPNRMAPQDEIISWKWLLNKKDVTIVVAPERGEDLNPREVARRILRLAEKNSAAFQRANARRSERMQGIQTLKTEIAALENELDEARHELEVVKVRAEETNDRNAAEKSAKHGAGVADITYRTEGLFTSFYPETKTGEDVWRTMAVQTDGTGKVLSSHAADVIRQIREAGYTVSESSGKEKEIDADTLFAELTGDSGESAEGNSSHAENRILIDAYLRAMAEDTKAINAAVDIDWDSLTDYAHASAVRDAFNAAIRGINRLEAARDALSAKDILYSEEFYSRVEDSDESRAHRKASETLRMTAFKFDHLFKELVKREGQLKMAALTPESPIEQAAIAIYQKHGFDVNEINGWHRELLSAIESKNTDFLRGIMTGVNPASVEIFERATGMKMAKPLERRFQQLDAWAGITEARRAEIEAEEDDRNRAAAREKSVTYAWNALKHLQIRYEDEILNSQDYLLRRFAEGFENVSSFKRGAATAYCLKKDDLSLSVNSRNFNAFLKAALAYGGLRPALERLGAVPAVSSPAAIPENPADPSPSPVEPPPAGQDATTQVDAVYRFAHASDDFKAWMFESLEKTEYSPFITARAMDQAARQHGAMVEWGFFSDATLDGIGSDGDDAQTDREADEDGFCEAEMGVTFEAETVVLDSATTDNASQGNYVGKIRKEGAVAGRIDIGDDGKAMVFVGETGNQRVVYSSGETATYSDGDGDGAAMVTALLTLPQNALPPEPSPKSSSDDAQKTADRALFQSVVSGTHRDMLSPELADVLEAAFLRQQGDSELSALFERAVVSYQNAMMNATASLF